MHQQSHQSTPALLQEEACLTLQTQKAAQGKHAKAMHTASLWHGEHGTGAGTFLQLALLSHIPQLHYHFQRSFWKEKQAARSWRWMVLLSYARICSSTQGGRDLLALLLHNLHCTKTGFDSQRRRHYQQRKHKVFSPNPVRHQESV